MPRLIDADALPVHKAYCVDEAGWGANFYVVDKSDIDKAPTIDAVPVVRCKDCHYSDEAKVNEKGFLICPASRMEITDYDFCSYGERRSDA